MRSSWRPLSTICTVRRSKLVAHRSVRNGATEGGDEGDARRLTSGLDSGAHRPTTIPAVAGFGAGAIHAAAIGTHADHLLLANAFVALAVAQLGSGVALLTMPGRAPAKAAIVVNLAAVVGWMVSRLVGVWFIPGLEVAEPPEFADTVCALLGALAAAEAALVLRVDTRLGPTQKWRPAITVRDMAVPAIAVILLTVPAMSLATTHTHEPHVDDHFDDTSGDDDETVDDETAGNATASERTQPRSAVQPSATQNARRRS